MGSTKIDAAKRDLAELNRRFHDRSLAGRSFYAQLMEKGFAHAKCVLIAFVPDGANTFVGKMIRQDGRVFEFDIDLDLSDLTTWSDVTMKFQEDMTSGRSKPWSPERLAYEEHLRMRASNEGG